MRSRTAAAVLAGIVIGAAAVGALLYLGAFTGSLTGTFTSQKFHVSDLHITTITTEVGSVTLSSASVTFTLSNRNNVPISSVGVSVNQGYTLEGGLMISSGNPISPGQSKYLQFGITQGYTPGQSYYVNITIGFGDGSMASYGATIIGP